MKFRIAPFFSFLFKVYAFNLALFFGCRLILFLIAIRKWPLSADFNFSDILTAFIIGVRFDTVVLSYILAIPFLLLGISCIFKLKLHGIIKIVHLFLILTLSSVLILEIANIPYFLHFFSPLSTAAFLWLDHPQYSFQMILQEKSFLIYIIPLILLIFLEFFFLRKLSRQYLVNINSINQKDANNFFPLSLYLLIGILIIFAGMRGRLTGKTPIQSGTAFFSDNALLNNIGLNPVFTLAQSYIADLNPATDKIKLISEKEGIDFVPEFLNIPEERINPNYPFSRIVTPVGAPDKMNVVIVIMEAMSKFKMGKWGGPENLTPTLNKLIDDSYYFNRIYTAGIHTFNGIYSTLFSFPALYKQQPFILLMQIPHDGLGNILRKEGYQTSFFTTHDPEFDNVKGFLMANGFDRIYSEFDYPSEWIQSTNGVADHKMFEYAIPQLELMAENHKPFLSVFMTTSDHGPYIIPAGINFIPKSKEVTDQIVEYADWSIERFLEDAKKTTWFSNTLFVLVADHGISMGHTYDMPLSFHETPLIFYAPAKFKEPKTFNQPGGQIDIAPTILGLLNIPYVNNTPGIDLLSEERPFIYFCADDKIGCIDKEHYLILRKNGKEALYSYENLSTTNLHSQFLSKTDSMKRYTYSMMQTCQWMIDNQRMKYIPASNTQSGK